MMLNLYFKSTR